MAMFFPTTRKEAPMSRIFTTSLTACLLAGAALMTAPPALAQRRGATGASQMRPPPAPGMTSPDRMRDQDRTRDQMRDGTGDRDRDRDRMRDQLRDRDQIRDQDRMRITQNIDGQIHSMQMLTQQERQQLRERVRSAGSEQERNQVRSEYQNTIRERARDLGVDAPFGPQRDGAGNRDGYQLAQMLSEQERLQFHQRMRGAGSEQERARIRTEMQTMARERAREMGIDLPEWYGERLRGGQD